MSEGSFVDYAGGTPMHALAYPLDAHGQEILHAVGVIGELLHDDDIWGRSDDPGRAADGRGRHRGAGGTLFHRYRVDESDVVTITNLIVSTTSNPGDERGRAPPCRAPPAWSQVTEGLLNHIEVAIRAFDPASPAPRTLWARSPSQSNWSLLGRQPGPSPEPGMRPRRRLRRRQPQPRRRRPRPAAGALGRLASNPGSRAGRSGADRRLPAQHQHALDLEGRVALGHRCRRRHASSTFPAWSRRWISGPAVMLELVPCCRSSSEPAGAGALRYPLRRGEEFGDWVKIRALAAWYADTAWDFLRTGRPEGRRSLCWTARLAMACGTPCVIGRRECPAALVERLARSAPGTQAGRGGPGTLRISGV